MSLSNAFHKALVEHFSGAKVEIKPQDLLSSREQFLSRIHYSWYADALTNLPPVEQMLLKSALPQSVAEKMSCPESKLPSLFAKNLAKVMGLYDLPPPVVMSKGPFFSLLEMDKESLTELISLLPFPLLAPQIKKIVDKKRLMGIYSLLNESQKDLLRGGLVRSDHASLIGLDLIKWTGSSSDLEMEIHKKGIQLLSQATRGEGEPFRFYLSLILDRGRGKMYLEAPEETLAKDPVGLLHAIIKYFNQRKSHGSAAKS